MLFYSIRPSAGPATPLMGASVDEGLPIQNGDEELLGQIDGVDSGEVTGWACLRGYMTRPLQVCMNCLTLMLTGNFGADACASAQARHAALTVCNGLMVSVWLPHKAWSPRLQAEFVSLNEASSCSGGGVCGWHKGGRCAGGRGDSAPHYSPPVRAGSGGVRPAAAAAAEGCRLQAQAAQPHAGQARGMLPSLSLIIL